MSKEAIIKGVIDMQVEIDDLRQQMKELRAQRTTAQTACYRLSRAVEEVQRDPKVNALIPLIVEVREALGIIGVKGFVE